MVNLCTLAKEISGTIEYLYPKTVASIVEYDSTQTVEEKIQAIDQAIATISANTSGTYYTKSEVDDLIYTKISLSAAINIGTSASGSAGTCYAEKGSSVSVTVKWTCSRSIGSAIPTTVTIDGVSQTINSNTGTATFNNVSANKTYAVVATDQKSTVSANCSVSFVNRVFYGVATEATFNNTFFNSLDSAVKSSRGTTFSGNASTGQYFWFCIPATYGTPKFTWNGSSSGGFILAGTGTYTNGSESTTYNVYRSTNPALGSNSIAVS